MEREQGGKSGSSLKIQDYKWFDRRAELAEFLKKSGVRAGMEGQPQVVIKAAQQGRVKPLQREIDAFKGNIDKLKKGGK